MKNKSISYADYILLFTKHAYSVMHVDAIEYMLLYCDFNFYYSNGVGYICLASMALSDLKSIKTAYNADELNFDVFFESLSNVHYKSSERCKVHESIGRYRVGTGLLNNSKA